jgi:putative ATPase
VFLGLASALAALKEPGVSNLAIPTHLRNVPAEVMEELEHGKDSKSGLNNRQGTVELEVRLLFVTPCVVLTKPLIH